MKKLVTLFSFITVLGLLLSACGGAATATETPAVAATEAPAVATEAPAEATTALTLWVYDDGRLEVLKKLGEQFQAEYGVALNVEVVDLSEIRNAMTCRERIIRALLITPWPIPVLISIMIWRSCSIPIWDSSPPYWSRSSAHPPPGSKMRSGPALPW